MSLDKHWRRGMKKHEILMGNDNNRKKRLEGSLENVLCNLTIYSPINDVVCFVPFFFQST